jgi:hypothetical protein
MQQHSTKLRASIVLVQRFSNTQAGSEPFAKFSTLLLFSTGYKSDDLIRCAWKRCVLIVQPLQFHDNATYLSHNYLENAGLGHCGVGSVS